jgi:tRNA threonylcarbamoyladenosine biosynthesis protein TsaE
MKTVHVRTLPELADIARETLSSCTQKDTATVIALTGDLGVGKTAFTKELAKLLGVSHEVTSPTFVIMKSYPIPSHPFFKTLTHIDAYRIESEDEIRVLGFAELLKDPTQLICIEWPEKIQNSIPTDALTISFTLLQDVRTVTYEF